MDECITETTCHFTPAASLAALGVVLEQREVFEPIRAYVQIEQKTVKHTPLDKLYDSFITRLSGAHGLVEINTLLRADHALQRAFGRKRCAEESVVQQTLDACGQLVEIVLNQDALLARRILFSLRQLLAPMHVAVNLGKT